MSETEDSSSRKVFDEVIFAKYQQAKVSVLSDVKPDIHTLTKTREQFLNEEILEPVLTYQKNKKIDYSQPESLLRELSEEISTDTFLPDIIREQYDLVIKEKLVKIAMLQQTQSLAFGEGVESSMYLFGEYADSLYGVVDPTNFQDVIKIIERDIKRKLDSGMLVAVQIEAATRLLSLIEAYKVRQVDYKSLDIKQTIFAVKESVIANAEELKTIFEKGLEDYNIKDDWVVAVDERGTRSTISVSYNLKKIYLPNTEQLLHRGDRKRLTAKRIQGLVAHEIGTHVLRKINGEKSCLKLLGSGLANFEQGEEGLATFREQDGKSFYKYTGLEAYLAIALAKGIDNNQPRNFAEVHKIFTDYYLVTESADHLHSKKLAWNRCLRIFRGTSGTVKGVVFSKDLMYRHGNIAHLKAVENGTIATTDIDSGKFDPTNVEHIIFMQKLSLLQ